MNLYDSKQYRDDLYCTIDHIVDLHKIAHSTVLVTGSTGTIGSFVIDTLLEMNRRNNMGIHVLAAGRNIQKLKSRFSHAKEGELSCVFYDVNLPIEFEYSVDYIIHAAGNATPRAFVSDPVGTIIGNVQGTYALLEYGRKHGIKRFLYVSSGEVYGIGNVGIDEISESYSGSLDSCSPRSCYPSSKRTAETLCASYADQYGIETVIVRPCHTYGPGMTVADDRAHAQFFRNALAGEDIVLKSAGGQMRSYSYVADCVSGLLTVLICGACGQAYNLASPDAQVTIAQLANVIAKAAGKNVVFSRPTEDDIRARSPIARQVLATDKLRGLGWRNEFGVTDGVDHMLSILKELEAKGI